MELPRIVKEKAKRIRAAWGRGEDTSGTYDNGLLDQFFGIHSKTEESAGGSPTSA